VLRHAQMHQAEKYLRNVHTRGSNPDGQLLIEADVIVYSPGWGLVAADIKERPEWFRGDKMNIRKGAAGQLPVRGRDIDLLRKALIDEDDEGRIREVKWWKPRSDRDVRHRVSKLRYEVSRDGKARLEEIVFDYNQSAISYRREPNGLFPEHDRRTLGLDQARR
jgi:hypothetical protein